MTKYGAILSDPPWNWRSWSPKGEGRSAMQHYSTLSLAEIKALPIADMAADDCALFLWSLNSMLPQALETIDAWGFTFKTVAFTWAKQTRRGFHFGLGYWTRQNTESCLLATRGKPKRIARNVPQLIVSPRREHSRKPDRVPMLIEELVGGPYCEMFARTRRPGWDVAYSNEADKFAPTYDGAADSLGSWELGIACQRAELVAGRKLTPSEMLASLSSDRPEGGRGERGE